jgi:dipeptidyl aminopeptidase/acylaminoacyl peptidase
MTLRAIAAVLSCLVGFGVLAADAPQKAITPPDSVIIDGVPPIPVDLTEKVDRYTEFRPAVFQDWHSMTEEAAKWRTDFPQMLILTRFAETNQVHGLMQAGGARTQLTFFPDRIESASFQPTRGDYFIFSKSAGGNEFYQNYRYDFGTGDITLLTDGKSRNSQPVWSNQGDRVAYTSTRRNGTDTDIYIESPNDIKTDHLLAQVKGGGWQIDDWSPDDKQILAREEISINESYLWLIDADSGERKAITPRDEKATKVSYTQAKFAKNGKGIFVTTDRDSEFQWLAYVERASGKHTNLLPEAKFDVDDWDLSHDGHSIAYTLNENGLSRLHVATIRVADGAVTAVATENDNIFSSTFPAVPAVINGIRWHKHDNTFAFNISSADSPSDVVVYHPGGRLTPWTQSETGGIPRYNFVQPKLVKWKSFDEREISGFFYQPDARHFPGRRPVIINIHGGPESQFRPGFLGRNNYFINELGCAMIFPNVRGSVGYGKSFLLLDNGFKREDAYKDIDALLAWIKTQPALDANRVMVTGGSYGGHMTLAVATYYADKIRCALDVVGISNLRTFLEHTESYRRDLRRVEYGDERDPKMREFMERSAPLNNAQKITKPLFVVAGANDPRVPKSEADQIVATLKKRNTPVWYLVGKDEGHGFAKKKNADYQFYATVQFINDYLLK